MSTEQRGVGDTALPDDRLRITSPNATVDANHCDARSQRRSPVGRELREPGLSHRIERTQLRVRVAALERALETSLRRRQAVIDHYERVLQDREPDGGEPSSSGRRTSTLLARLLEGWR